MNPPEAENTRIVVRRRRRTRRHRRNRKIRRALLAVACLILTFAFAAIPLRYLSPSLFGQLRHSEPTRESAEASRNLFLAVQEQALQQIQNRPIYPYSVVKGGVRDVHELKWAAEHDPVVAAHYAGFDYDHARVVRLVLARTAYVSYRIGNKVYWTRHRVSLKKGETLITDGKMTARTRCANRVEEQPQQLNSELEPPAMKFDQPLLPAVGTAMANPPVPFQSSLLSRPGNPALGSGPPLGLYDPIGGGNITPVFLPNLPTVCGIGVKKTGSGTTTTGTASKKKTPNPCGNEGGGGTVPEPGSWLLVATGLGAMYWAYQRRWARV